MKKKLLYFNLKKPNSEIFEMFDSLCLLAGDGDLAYFGSRGDAPRFFEEYNRI